MSRSCLLVLAVAVLIALPSIVPAQVVPYGPLPGPMAGPPPFGGLRYGTAPWYAWITDLTLGDFKAGFFYGWGSIKIVQNADEGPSDAFVPGQGPQFAAFEHRRKTDLSDLYLSAQWGLKSRGVEILSVSLATSLGFRTNFTQTTEQGTGITNLGAPLGQVRQALATLVIPNGTEGEFQLGTTNRVWAVDVVGALPVTRRIDFLVGYKAARDRSSPDPSATQPPVLGRAQLSDSLNWWNLWINVLPSGTGCFFDQFLSYHGPTIGGRIRNFPQPLQRLSWHVELLCAPYLFGTYEFTWSGGVNSGGEFVVGRERTDASGLWRYCIETRFGGGYNLVYGLRLDVTGMYSHLYMEGSEPQVQIASSNFTPPVGIDQTASQSITLTRNFWGIGGNLVVPF